MSGQDQTGQAYQMNDNNAKTCRVFPEQICLATHQHNYTDEENFLVLS